jgi:hypothetical protein
MIDDKTMCSRCFEVMLMKDLISHWDSQHPQKDEDDD